MTDPDPRTRLGAVMRGAARLALGALLAVVLVLLAGPASAHAVLESSDPGPESVVQALPRAVTLRFDEPVTIVPGSLRVYDPDGRRVDRGDVVHPAGRGERLAVSLTGGSDGPQGSYLVSWRVVSDDSHPVSGAFTFALGHAGSAPSVPQDNASRGIGVGLGVARGLGYAGSALLVGVLLVVAWCWAEAWAESWAGRRVRRIALAGAVLLAVGAVASLLLKGPYDAALGLGGLTDSTLLREVAGSTYGRATIARLVLAVLAGCLLARRSPRCPLSPAPLTAFAIAVGLSFAFAGHAAAGSGRTLALINDTVHLVAASVWLGSLVLLVLVVPTAVDDPRDGAAVVRRFSQLALGAVLLLAATGVWQAARHVGSWAALGHTRYGHELLAKLAVVAAVLVLAGASRALLWRGAATAVPPRLRALVLAETVGLGIVLTLTSALVATEPADTAYRPSVTAELTLVGDTVQVLAVPAGDRQMRVHLSVTDRGGRPSDPKQLSATVSLPSRDEARQLGPLPIDLKGIGPGHRSGIVGVPVTGAWRLAVTVRTTAIDEATGYVTLPIR